MADFDLAIIGGGINGTGIARDAAGRGLRVLAGGDPSSGQCRERVCTATTGQGNQDGSNAFACSRRL